MKTNEPLTDEAIESMLARRMSRAHPTRLLESIMNDVETTEQRRRSPMGWRWPARTSGLAFAGILVTAGLLTALVLGGSLSSGRPQPDQSNQGPAVTSATPPPSGGIRMLTCDARPLPLSGRIDLTGTWNGGSLVYLRQDGATVWGVAIFDPFCPYLNPVISDVGPYLVLHGTIASDGKVHVDWASAGDRFPDEHRFEQFQDASGSIVFDVQADSGGNAELVATTETGSAWSGGSFSTLTLTPCTAVLH